MRPTFKEMQLIDACRHIFGEDPDISVDFLNYLQPEGLKAAFRRRAIATHPDTTAYSAKPENSSEVFARVLESYHFVSRYLETRKGIAHHNHHLHHTYPAVERAAENLTLNPKEVKFGRFLLEAGVIDFRTLLASLSWQRSTYQRLGRIMKDSGWLSPFQINDVIRSGWSTPFGERCICMGYITERQLNHSLFLQKCQKKPIGEYFTVNRHFSEADLKRYLKLHRQHNAQICREVYS